MTRTVYRYDNQNYADGQVIKSRGDHYEGLCDNEKIVEWHIREHLPNGIFIRKCSLYACENLSSGRNLWKYSKKQYLYELEIEDKNINFVGNLDSYSAAVDAVGNTKLLEEKVEQYCKGEVLDQNIDIRLEVLVCEAKVIRKVIDRDECDKPKEQFPVDF